MPVRFRASCCVCTRRSSRVVAIQGLLARTLNHRAYEGFRSDVTLSTEHFVLQVQHFRPVKKRKHDRGAVWLRFRALDAVKGRGGRGRGHVRDQCGGSEILQVRTYGVRTYENSLFFCAVGCEVLRRVVVRVSVFPTSFVSCFAVGRVVLRLCAFVCVVCVVCVFPTPFTTT